MTADRAIDLDQLRRELIWPGGLWQQVDYVAETGSTNADLAAAARTGAVEPGAVLVTDYQSAGRGRLGRTWTAPPGTSIAMSVLVRPDGVDPSRWTWLPLLTGLAVADGLSGAAGLEARLKWPNDVLVGDRKVCGILAERVETRTGRPASSGWASTPTWTAAELPVPDRHLGRHRVLPPPGGRSRAGPASWPPYWRRSSCSSGAGWPHPTTHGWPRHTGADRPPWAGPSAS